MQDRELKKLLEETCPVLPGQESRAWANLRGELYGPKTKASGWRSLFSPSWHSAFVATAALVVVVFIGDLFVMNRNAHSLATADSQAPGIYATAFYSHNAEAQVVWLNGMEPAHDRPTYLDPTTVVPQAPPQPAPVSDPNSL